MRATGSSRTAAASATCRFSMAEWAGEPSLPLEVDYSTFTDDDFRLGLNAGQTTLAAIAELAGATISEK